jgi:hypothetical protein
MLQFDRKIPAPLSAGVPVSGDHASKVVNYVYDLIEQELPWRDDWAPDVDRSVNLWVGRHWISAAPVGVKQIVVNRLQTAMAAQVAVQTEQHHRLKFSPVDNGGDAPVYINTNARINPQQKEFLKQFAVETMLRWKDQNGVERYPRKLEPPEIEQFDLLISQGMLPPEVKLEVTDQVFSEALQQLHDKKWEACDADFYVTEGVFLKTTFGTQSTVYGFDDSTKNHRLFNPLPFAVLYDHRHTHIRDMAHVVYIEFVPVEEALLRYPEHEQAIIDSIQTGTLDYRFRPEIRIPAIYSAHDYKTQMVAITYAWLRHHKFPMTEAEAVESGAVSRVLEQTMVPGVTEVPDPESGALMTVPAMVPGPTSVRFILPDGTDTTPEMPTWPMRPAIREICLIGDVLAHDRQAEYADIPVGMMINKPVPGTPYGQGEPAHIEPLQMAVNGVISDLVNYCSYFGTPPLVVPQSVADKLPGFKDGVYGSMAGQRWTVPDDLMEKYKGMLAAFLPPAQLPNDLIEFLQLLLQLIDREANNADVLNGISPAGRSGEAIDSLAAMARGPIAWKASSVERYLRSLGRLMLHTYRTRLGPEDCARIVGKYPVQVWYAIHDRIKSTEFDVSIELAALSGQAKAKKKEEAATLYGQGQGPLSETTLLEAFERDPKVERQNKIREAKEKAEDATKVQNALGIAPPAVGGAMPPGLAEQPAPAQSV